jgi:transposase InsO family protein
LASIFLKEVVQLHGLPESIVSDHDPKFTSKWWREIHRLLGTKLLMSTLFHPQIDGATEWANHSIGQILRLMV